MSPFSYRRLLSGVVGAVATLALVAPSVAHAEESTSSPFTDPELNEIIEYSSQSALSSDYNLRFALSTVSAFGFSNILPDYSVGVDPNYPLETREGIEQAEVLYQGEPNQDGIEEWTVASPSMKRDVTVLIRRAPDHEAAPMLYLLDGVDAPKSSGVIGAGRIHKTLAEENVTMVFPTQARGSLYYDWESYDPNLGLHMWETFLTKELRPLLEAEIPFNGKRAVGGVSMGSGGALNLINRNPDLFDAAFGISGCYSNSDPVGEHTQNAIVQSRGGNIDNMVGEKGSQAWKDHDVAADVSALTDKTIYLSAATGSLNEDDLKFYASWDPIDVLSGVVLEQGSYYCTKRLAGELESAGAQDIEVVFDDYGAHHWGRFQPHLEPAWEHIKPALQD